MGTAGHPVACDGARIDNLYIGLRVSKFEPHVVALECIFYRPFAVRVDHGNVDLGVELEGKRPATWRVFSSLPGGVGEQQLLRVFAVNPLQRLDGPQKNLDVTLGIEVAMEGAIVKSCVLRSSESGSVLHYTIHKNSPLKQEDQMLMGV